MSAIHPDTCPIPQSGIIEPDESTEHELYDDTFQPHVRTKMINLKYGNSYDNLLHAESASGM